jgi:uncharacterized protein YqcC (DUF446 family)
MDRIVRSLSKIEADVKSRRAWKPSVPEDEALESAIGRAQLAFEEETRCQLEVVREMLIQARERLIELQKRVGIG